MQKKALNTHDFFQKYGQKDSIIYFLPDRIKIIDNHLRNQASRNLLVEMNTGHFVAITPTDDQEGNINFLNFKNNSLNSKIPQEAFRDLLNSINKISGENKQIEVSLFSNSIGTPDSVEEWLEICKNIADKKPIPVNNIPKGKRLLEKYGNTETELSIPTANEYSLVYLSHHCSTEQIASLLKVRAKELDEILETINTFFEVSSLDQLSGADQDWLDKLIESPILKMRLRHIVNQNTAIDFAKELLMNGKTEAFGKLLNQVQESLILDFELNCEPVDALINEAVQSGLSVGSTSTMNDKEYGSLHLIKNSELDNFKNWLQTKNKNQKRPELLILY